MAFPLECVEPLCDAFLKRTEGLLVDKVPAFPKIHYGVLTLKLLAEKNEAALHHLTLAVARQHNKFLVSAFDFLLRDITQKEEFPEDLLCDFLSKIFEHISAETKTEFENDFAVRKAVAHLQSLDKLKKVSRTTVDLLLRTLLHLSSQKNQYTYLSVIMDLLPCDSLHPSTGVLVKAVAIRLLSSLSQVMNHKVLVSFEEAAFLRSATTSRSLANTEVLQLLKCLILYEENKKIFLEQDIMEFLSPLIDESSTQEYAAELLYALMSPCSTSDGVPSGFENGPAVLSHDLSAEVDEKSQHNDGVFGLLEVLISCAVKCFCSFISSCDSQSAASLNLMYTSTLVQMILDVFKQEAEHTQGKLADTASKIFEAPETFVHMLWGSSIVISCDSSQLPPLPWISTFFEIQNLLILCTHFSEEFCLALCTTGFVYFMECEVEKLGKMRTSIATNEIQRARVVSLLTIMYNCVQKNECLYLFISARHLATSLATFASSPCFEIRLLCKLILGFLKLNLDTELQQRVLKIQADEALYILASLAGTDEGYSAEELLQGILNLSELEENFVTCTSLPMLKLFDSFLGTKDCTVHGLVLQIIWNILIMANSQDNKICSTLKDGLPAIKTMTVFSHVETIHECICTLVDHQGTVGNDTLNLLAYARCCYQYRKFKECIATADTLLRLLKVGEVDQAVVNEAKLLKGKSLFFHYQSMQHVYLQKRGEEVIKEVEKLKQECYDSTKEAILILGSAQDHSFLDEEGSKLLDFAMIDYLRETNDLNRCQRCLLCRKKTKLRRSHVFPKSILKDIATDLITGDDHKVFSTMVGKIVKKSAGEMTFGMLCGKCEQCLCQNGENQFSEHIHHKICINREVVESQLNLPYGSWLYDFCVGILFRSIAVSTVFNEFRFSGESLYKLFCNCRKHLLSLATNVPIKAKEGLGSGEMVTTPVPPNKPLEINFFVNPTINPSSFFDLEYILKAPAIFINPVCLHKGIYSHSKRLATLLVHFDRMNILVQLETPPPFVFHDFEISPHGGVLVIPEEHKRWQSVPTGVWKLFSAISQASTNISNLKSKSVEDADAAESTEKLNKLVYSPENIVTLNRSKVFSLLPSSIKFSCDNITAVTFPKNHQVLIRKTRQWNKEQEIVFFVVENCFVLYLVFVLSVPGWHMLDGLFFDKYNSSVALPYLNGKAKERHPLSLSVIQALMEQVPLILEYILDRPQLS